jgi:lysine-specific permease
LSAIKITAVVIFIAIGFLIAFGGFGQEPLWFTNFTIPGAPFKNGALGIIEVVLIAFFSFGGTELVGIAAGETLDPAKTVPKAIYGTFWRILIFYILSIFVMGLVIPNNDPRLTLGASAGHGLDATVSPFTLVMQKIPLENGKFVADIMNAVILSAVLSAGNSAMYASSRTLMSMAVDGKAPKIFSKVSTRGIPWVALMATMAIASIAFLGIVLGNGLLFEYLIRMTGISGVLTWISICVIHLRFRAAYVKQGKKLSDLPYRAPLFPLGPYIAIFLGLVVIIAVGVSTIYSADCVWRELMIVYFGIPIFFGLLGIYKWLYRSKMIPLEEVDFSKV